MDIKISDEAEMTASVDRLGTAWIEESVRTLWSGASHDRGRTGHSA